MIDPWILLYSFGSIFIFMLIMFFVAIIVKNNSIIDICWSLNFVIATLVSFFVNGFQNQTFYLSQIVLTGLIVIWGYRLAYHIAKRNLGKGEDKRYKERRDAWGKNFYVKTFFLIFMLQALWAAIIVSPVVVANSVVRTEPWTSWIVYDVSAGLIVPLVVGEVIWILGFYFEVMGDRQLRLFIKNPENKGKVIETGLWKYTRHPNYFGEITMSWGLFIIGISLAFENPFFLITLVGPILYTLLIRYVTGVPEVEKHLITKPGYKEYMERTSVLIPWIPKKKINKNKSD
ncbi:MAG TPA: DUF1295 domain-containing protein [candidate division Zixibacteria bacterium]|nr:DUF1295 domain-containing protein [candidate division Zixibacteria bacterium]